MPMVLAAKCAPTRWLVPEIKAGKMVAMEKPIKAPVVPDIMAGYSGVPLIKKLGIKPGTVLALLGAPPRFDKTLGKLPDDVRVKRQARGTADVIILFVRSLADLKRRFPASAKALVTGGRLWIAWPKKASGVTTDLTQNVVRAYGLASGMVDYKISAIDETWSGLCFTQRRPGGRRR